jgi:hypothetical protein
MTIAPTSGPQGTGSASGSDPKSASPYGSEVTVDETLLVDGLRAVLVRCGAENWRVRPGKSWCHVEPPGGAPGMQGWKLHLSATPLSAPVVLARAADVLVRHRCPFKFAPTLRLVQELGSRGCDRGVGGKFLTVYPDLHGDELRALAAELHRVTEGLPGPGILSDKPYRPGSLVHYRFGTFTGVPVLGNDGTYEAMLMAPDGSLVPDQRKAWFTPPPWAPPDPFRPLPPAGTGAPTKPVLLNGRYLVREVIRHAFTGGVYRATDEVTGETVVLKQARPHAGADLTGRDARDARRHEGAMLELFGPSGLTPRLLELFEQQGDLFLTQEAVPGVTLREWVPDNIEPDDGGPWGNSPVTVARMAGALVDLVALVHGQGLVLRDLDPNNVMVTPDGELRLIDLELLARPGELVAAAYTPGYVAPELAGLPAIGPAPEPAADLFGLGATLFYLVTGTDPLLPPDEPHPRPHRERIASWLHQVAGGNEAARRLAPIIAALLHEDPARRPGLEAVRAGLADRSAPAPTAVARGIDDGDLRRMVDDALEHLVATMDPDHATRLWPSAAFGATTDPLNVQHGAAGVLRVLTLAHEVSRDPGLREAVDITARWIGRRAHQEPRVLPGLYFGRSGTAWALLEAGRTLGDRDLVSVAADLARRVPVRWPNPDVCHGVAGAGLTQLRFWECTGEDEFLTRACQAADSLVSAVRRQGSEVLWPIPQDFPSDMAGVVHYGFAHGIAGVGTFLLATGRVTGTDVYLDLAASAAETLAAAAEVDRGAAYWTAGPKGGRAKTNWCSGSSGVGAFLVRVWQHGGDARCAELSEQAAVAVRRSRWHAGTTQCHGLAGDGEFLLDLADSLGDERYRDWAAELAVGLHVRHALRAGRLVIPDEMGNDVVADFGTGLSGVTAFLLRLQHRGARQWLPDSRAGGR